MARAFVALCLRAGPTLSAFRLKFALYRRKPTASCDLSDDPNIRPVRTCTLTPPRSDPECQRACPAHDAGAEKIISDWARCRKEHCTASRVVPRADAFGNLGQLAISRLHTNLPQKASTTDQQEEPRASHVRWSREGQASRSALRRTDRDMLVPAHDRLSAATIPGLCPPRSGL